MKQLILIMCVLLSLPAWGQTKRLLWRKVGTDTTGFYVASNGNDANTGHGAPWKTLAKVQATSFSPGAHIYFNRGDTWKESLIFPSSGTSANPIVLDAYGSGSYPIFTGRDTISGWSSPANWTNTSGNIWSIAYTPGNPYRVWLSGVEYGDYDTLASIGTRYRWYYSSNILYVYSVGNPASYYSSVETPRGIDQVVTLDHQTNVTLRHLNIQGGAVGVHASYTCTNLLFEYDTLGQNTGAYALRIGTERHPPTLALSAIVYLTGKTRFTTPTSRGTARRI